MNEYNFYKILKGSNITPDIIELTRDLLTIEKYYSTLGEALINNSFNKEELDRIYNDVRKLIDRLHEKGIIHGDLHNDNIVCNEDVTEFRIIDFEQSTFIYLVDDDYIEEYNGEFDINAVNVAGILKHELNNFIL